jgi:predicted AAA+ superfamily ATPase
MTLGEIKGRPAADTISRIFKGGLPKPRAIAADKSKDPYPFMAKGFMPALMAVNKGEECARWWEGYVTTYLERDLRQMSQIDSLPDFRRFMEAVALRSGQLLNQTDIARDVGVSQATVYRYINLLDTTCLLRRVPAYAKNRTKRLIKSSKAYLIDPALTAFLCGHFEEEALKTAKEAGSIFECMVLLHLEALCELMTPKARIFYWRTVSGREVDFVVEYGKKLIAVEAKLSRSIDYKQTQGLRAFMEDYPETVAGMIAYTGNEIRYLGEKILAVPWTVFAGLS